MIAGSFLIFVGIRLSPYMIGFNNSPNNGVPHIVRVRRLRKHFKDGMNQLEGPWNLNSQHPSSQDPVLNTFLPFRQGPVELHHVVVSDADVSCLTWLYP